MKFYQFIRIYIGYALVFVSYKASVFTLNKLFNMIDEVIDSEHNGLLDSTDGVIETCEESVRGGNDLILKKGTELSKAWNHVKRFGDKSISTIIKPIAATIGYLLLKFPSLNKIYCAFKNLKLIIASAVALSAVRIVARFDYWALIICGALPKTDLGDKIMLAGIRRIRMGMNNLEVCIPRTEQIINLVTDETTDLKTKNESLIEMLNVYEFLPDGHPFKNSYFVCIVHMFITLFVINKLSFRLAIKILARMLKNGHISLDTYLEILSQLLVAGIPPVEVDI